MRLKFSSIGIYLLFFLFLLPGLSPAQDLGKITIAVFPFEINGPEDVSYLKESLPKLLKERLEAQGFQTVELDKVQKVLEEEQVEYLDLSTVKNLSLLLDANLGLYGSFSQVGESISLDTRLVEAYGLKPAKALFVVKKGLINLLPAVDELVAKIKLEVLKKEQIAEIEVKGNKILDKETILLRLKTKKGDIFDPKTINEDLKNLYDLGYFQDIRFGLADVPEGKKLIIEVKEKPLIQAISVEGAKEIDADDILEAISSKKGSILNLKIVSEDLDKIRELYRKKGFYQAKVSYKLEGDGQKAARLVFVIDEGKKLYIKKITIEGAKQLDPDDIKDELALQERGIFSWLTGTGILKEEYLERDAAFIEAYYGNRGFIEVKVGKPEVKFKEDGIYIIFKVHEGERYRVGKVSIEEEGLFPLDTLYGLIKMDDLARDKEYFDRSVLRDDSQKLADFYTNYGYAYAECDVDLNPNPKEKVVDVSYIPKKGEKVYIRRLLIEGNTYTRDNVIRREMRLVDGDLFSGQKLKRSNVRLNKLDYFETVDIQTVPASTPSEMDLVVKVKEKPTGMISAGAGYSSLDKVFFTARIQKRNLFGKGYAIGLTGTFSGRRTSYTGYFWNPRYNDSKLGVGFSAYRSSEEYFDFDKTSTGGKLNFAYPLGEYTALSWSYRLEQYTISNVDEDADEDIKDMEGDNWASTLYASISRDTTDRLLNPTRGTKNTLSLEYSGGVIGGDDNFIKTIYDFSYYKPLWWEHIFHWHFRLGYVTKNGEEEIPTFERFYLGGIDSVRGYPGREIAPKYDNGDYKGGNKEFFTNVEYLFPLYKEMGILGLVFFDAGNTWDESESMDTDLYKSVGTGIRWYSPLGPLRLEFGYALDELDGERPKKLEFSVGQFY